MLFQDTNDDKIDLTLFEDAIHQIAKLTSDTVEVKGLTQADIFCSLRHSSVYLIIDEAKSLKMYTAMLLLILVLNFVVVPSQVE